MSLNSGFNLMVIKDEFTIYIGREMDAKCQTGKVSVQHAHSKYLFIHIFNPNKFFPT